MPIKYILSLLLLMLLSVACANASTGVTTAAPGATIPQTSVPHYDMGNPTLPDLWVDPVNGDDSRSGASRAEALRTIAAVWQRIPTGVLTATGYRLQLVAGTHPASGLPNYWDDRRETRQLPVILKAADGAGTAEIQGPGHSLRRCHLHYPRFPCLAKPDTGRGCGELS